MDAHMTLERKPLSDLQPAGYNPREIDDASLDALEASITEFGYVEPIVWNRTTGHVVGGHQRLKILERRGVEEVEVVVVELDEVQEKALNVALNSPKIQGWFDPPRLQALLDEIREQTPAFDRLRLNELAAKAAEDLKAMARQQGREPAAEVDDPGPQEAPHEPRTQTGDLWLLGDHRLLCGDSTSSEDLTRLMGGEKAALLATDPPYLVDYQGGNHPQSWANWSEKRDKHWDDYREGEGLEFFVAWLRCALEHLVPNGAVYQWHATRRQSLVERAWEECGLLVHQTIVWVKARAVLTRCHYMWRSEPAFYGWRKGHMPPIDRRPDSNAQNVWEIDQQGEMDGIHPTQKPRELFRRPIVFHTRPGEIVLEPFSGSGTQLIAAEEMGRRCYAMEISPAFVDVAVKRWEGATGRTAERAE